MLEELNRIFFCGVFSANLTILGGDSVFSRKKFFLNRPNVYSKWAFHVFLTEKRDSLRQPESIPKQFAECQVKTKKRGLHFWNPRVFAGLIRLVYYKSLYTAGFEVRTKRKKSLHFWNPQISAGMVFNILSLLSANFTLCTEDV